MLIKHLCSGLETANAYLFDVWGGKLFQLSAPDSCTEDRNVDSNLPHRNVVKLNEQAWDTLSTELVWEQWMLSTVLTVIFGNSLNYPAQHPYF